jgi:hypothetical protein
MKLLAAFAAAVILTTPAFGTLIVQESVNCQLGSQTQFVASSQIGTISCGLTGSNPFANVTASAAGAASISGNSIFLEADASSNVLPLSPPPSLFDATARVNLTYADLFTLGVERPGFVHLIISGGGDSISAGLGFGSASAFGLSESFNHGVSVVLAIQLGIPFSLSASANGLIGGGTGRISASLFEADGTTPTPIQEAPEPKTWWLMGAGLALLMIGRVGRRVWS